MQLGTTQDTFLRLNMEWLSRATNWSKFAATAQLGLVHRGNWKNGFKVLKQYLGTEVPVPTEVAVARDGVTVETVGHHATTPGAQYSESGALFALGLIHSNKPDPVIKTYLVDSLNAASASRNVDVMQHGASLALGIQLMGSGDRDVYDNLRNVLFTDSAVAGEAASIAMGLIMIGTLQQNGDLVEELLVYARETKHEKIIRGIAVAIALFCYGTGEMALVTLDMLFKDKVSFCFFAFL